MTLKRSAVIVDGFDIDSALVCEGVVGDGCGGGRIFYIEDEKLFAYDPYSKTKIKLRENIIGAKHLEKNACVLTIKTARETLKLDLSEL